MGELGQGKRAMDEIMCKMKAVCEGYNALKEKSKSQVDAMQNELKDERNNAQKLQHEVNEVQRDRDKFVHECGQQKDEIEGLNHKLTETQKLAAMIQNLMSKNNG